MTAFFFLNGPILRLFGAEGDIYAYGKEYLDVIVLGSVFQIFATGLVPAIRNNGGATFAFVTMLSGFGSNIVLDYVFVWVLEGGTAGAAVATILGQAVTAAEALIYFLVKKLPLFGSFRRFGRCAASIVRVGVAPFGLTLSPMISLMLINKFCMLHGGESAVACYACIAYAVTIVQMLVQGVGDGSQPLISTFYGEGRPEKSAKVEADRAFIRLFRRSRGGRCRRSADLSCRARLLRLFARGDGGLLRDGTHPLFLSFGVFRARAHARPAHHPPRVLGADGRLVERRFRAGLDGGAVPSPHPSHPQKRAPHPEKRFIFEHLTLGRAAHGFQARQPDFHPVSVQPSNSWIFPQAMRSASCGVKSICPKISKYAS